MMDNWELEIFCGRPGPTYGVTSSEGFETLNINYNMYVLYRAAHLTHATVYACILFLHEINILAQSKIHQ